MLFSRDEINKFKAIIEELFDQILIENIPTEISYKGFLDKGQGFALDEEGYFGTYSNLMHYVFSFQRLNDQWSRQGIDEKIHHLLLELTQHKVQGKTLQNSLEITKLWLRGIDIKFDSRKCYVPIIGLVVEEPLIISDVVFYPIKTIENKLENKLITSFFDDLLPHRDCIASSEITADWFKATEILRSRAEEALNILRYIGSLVWNREPTRLIYVAGKHHERVSYALSIDSEGYISEVGDTQYTSLPFKVNKEFMPYAEFYGLSYIQSLMESRARHEIENSFLIALQWFGDATQDFVPLTAFMKFYISIEACTKILGERAKKCLPRRLSVLLSPWKKNTQIQLESEIKTLIEERNEVFHSGKPKNNDVNYLLWDAKRIATGTLNQLRQRIKTEGLQTKEDLKVWVNLHYKKYLR